MCETFGFFDRWNSASDVEIYAAQKCLVVDRGVALDLLLGQTRGDEFVNALFRRLFCNRDSKRCEEENEDSFHIFKHRGPQVDLSVRVDIDCTQIEPAT